MVCSMVVLGMRMCGVICALAHIADVISKVAYLMSGGVV